MSDLSHLCGASMPGAFVGTMLGPCVLRHRHDGPTHQAADGSKWTAIERHPFQQLENVAVNVCVCGKWPTHHVHLGELPQSCGCDECRAPDDGQIRAHLDQHPEVLREFLHREVRRDPEWFRTYLRKETRIAGRFPFQPPL